MKKKFYKSVWFWVAIVFIVFSGILVKACFEFTDETTNLKSQNEALVKKNKKLDKKYNNLKKAIVSAFGSSSSSDSDSDSSSDSSSKESSSSKKYAVNEEATLSSNDEKMLGLTLTSATKNFDAHGQGLVGNDYGLAITNENSVQLTFKYNNYAYDESWLPELSDFTVYDASGQAGTVVNQQEGQDEVAKGRSSQTTFWVNFKDATPAGSKIEIDYQGDGLDSPLTFTATVQ